MRVHATNATKLAARAVLACVLVYGVRILERTALAAFGGREKLMFFETNDAHRFTSMAMLHGTLKLRNALSLMWHDEQVFNGAVYTNWGFGVPLLQLPFHAFARIRSYPQTFFPDRAIYFSYLAVTIPLLWAGLDRALATATILERTPVRRYLVSWTATSLALTCCVYPLMASRFIVYEETVCYSVVFALLAIAAYGFALGTWNPLAVGALGLVASMGLLIRPTGLFYFLLWAGTIALESKSRRAVAIFSASAAPLLCFWLFSNWVRSGSPLGLGLTNALPWSSYHTPMLRFGSSCLDSFAHAREAAVRLFDGLFFSTADEATPWMRQCHFDYEEEPLPFGTLSAHEAFLGTSVLAVVAWMFFHLLALRERRLTVYAPFLVLVTLFASYLWAGAGFAWRYIGDFWPAIVLACIHYLRALPGGGRGVLGLRLAFLFVLGSKVIYERKVEPFQSTMETLNEARTGMMLETFHKALSATDPPLPARLECGDRPQAPFHNGLGWNGDCTVDTFTNLDLGVLPKGGDRYDLWFSTDGITGDKFRVYLNGRYYEARRDGAAYHATVRIPYARLNAKVVMLTIQWVAGVVAPKGRLLSVLLT